LTSLSSFSRYLQMISNLIIVSKQTMKCLLFYHNPTIDYRPSDNPARFTTINKYWLQLISSFFLTISTFLQCHMDFWTTSPASRSPNDKKFSIQVQVYKQTHLNFKALDSLFNIFPNPNIWLKDVIDVMDIDSNINPLKSRPWRSVRDAFRISSTGWWWVELIYWCLGHLFLW